jgi:hypothetical protein
MKNFNYVSPIALRSLTHAETHIMTIGNTVRKSGYGVGISGEENVQNRMQ